MINVTINVMSEVHTFRIIVTVLVPVRDVRSSFPDKRNKGV